MISAWKEKPEQNRTACCALSFLLQVDTVDRSLPDSSPLASMATYSSWFSPLSQSPCKGHVLFCPALGDCFVYSLLTLFPVYHFIAASLLLPPRPVSQSAPLEASVTILREWPRDAPKCSLWIHLCSRPAPPQSAMPPFTRVPKTGTLQSPWALPTSSHPNAERNCGLSVLPLQTLLSSPLPPLSPLQSGPLPSVSWITAVIFSLVFLLLILHFFQSSLQAVLSFKYA